LTCVTLHGLGAQKDMRRVSHVQFLNHFNIALAFVRVLAERREVDGVALWDSCGEDEGLGKGSCNGERGVAAVVQMDVDLEVGGRERMVWVKTIRNGLCKMTLKRLCVAHSVTPHLLQCSDCEWARHERGRYHRV
jgi:hypothetical protein